MRIEGSRGRIVLRDRPGPMWVLGLLLLAGAAVAILMPLGLATNAAVLRPWQRLASIGIGVLGGAGTLWWLAVNPSTRVDIDPARRRVRIVRTSLTGRRVREFGLDEIEQVGVQSGSDSDGGSVWRPVVRLKSTDDVLLSVLWSHDRKAIEASVAAVAEVARRG